MVESEVRNWIVSYLSDYLDMPTSKIAPDTPLKDLGIDSLEVVVLAGAMEDQFDLNGDLALFLRNSTIDSLIVDLRNDGLL
jgi:phthiocerol/phenolphthiocerol synthesis type-I polyketide synthase B